MIRQGRPRVAIGIAVAASLAVGPHLVASPTWAVGVRNGVPAATPHRVVLPVLTEDTPGRDGQNGTIEMTLGASTTIRVIVDTGFAGLVVFPDAWGRTPAGITLSSTSSSAPAPDGSTSSGVRGSAFMGFGGVRTTSALPFVYATKDNAYLAQWAAKGVYGLLGVGTKGTPGLVNPFTALPGALGQRWSMHFARTVPGVDARRGAIVLGASRPTDPEMAFSLPHAGTNSVGATLWNDHDAAGCWRFGTLPLQCVDTWFDAAFTVMRVAGRQFADVPTDARGRVRPGVRVAFAAKGSAFTAHRFRAGSQASRNLVKVIPHGGGQVNTGNSFYFDYTLTYDMTNGRIDVAAPTVAGH